MSGAPAAVAERLKICLLGQPFWADRLRKALEAHQSDRVSISTLYPQRFPPRKDWRRAVRADVLMRIGYRPGAMTPFGVAFDLFWSMLRRANPTAAVAYYWIGTDVLNALAEARAKRTRKAFTSSFSDIHLCDAPWLTAELEETGVVPAQIHFPSPLLRSRTLPPLPEQFTVLTYIPDRRYLFYGGPAIVEAARRLPDIRFEVVAGTGKWLDRQPPNLVFRGWQSDMAAMYRACTVVVRILEHDSLGATVQEGLGFGRHVVYCYPVPFTHRVANGDIDGLVRTLSSLYAQHAAGLLRPNEEGWRYALEEYSEVRYTRQLVDHLFARVRPQTETPVIALKETF